MHSRSKFQVFINIIQDVINDCLEAVCSSSCADLFSLYAYHIWKCKKQNEDDACNANISDIEIKISLVVTYLTFISQVIHLLKPQVRENILYKLWRGLMRTAEMHTLLLELYLYLNALIKVGRPARSWDDPEFLNLAVTDAEFFSGALITGSLALFANSNLRNHRQQNINARALHIKIMDGFFGALEGISTGQNLITSGQTIHNDLHPKAKVSFFNRYTIGVLSGTSTLYGGILGTLHAIYSPPEVTENIFAPSVQPYARTLNILQSLFFSIFFGLTLVLNLKQENGEDSTNHLIEFYVLIGLYLFKGVLQNLCCQEPPDGFVALTDEKHDDQEHKPERKSKFKEETHSGYRAIEVAEEVVIDAVSPRKEDDQSQPLTPFEPLSETKASSQTSTTSALLITLNQPKQKPPPAQFTDQQEEGLKQTFNSRFTAIYSFLKELRPTRNRKKIDNKIEEKQVLSHTQMAIT